MGFYFPVISLSGVENQEYIYPSLDELGLKSTNNEEFWELVQKSFYQHPGFLNLENGWLSPMPLQVLEDFIRKERMINEQPSFYMRRLQDNDTDRVRKELAAFAQLDDEEVALVRNTTEGLNIVINGLPLKKGDEAILTNQDYGSMIEAFEMRAKREGIVIKTIQIPLQPANDEEIVDAFERAITPKTKVMLVTHMINTTGQILPVRKICDMAHSKGVEVIVDGAHAFAHIDFKITDLNCDYFSASLHKWLCTPPGSGILWMRKDKIEKVWPVFGDTTYPATDIRKFEHYGTHHRAFRLAISTSINFHNLVGSKRKEERLRYLKNYWVNAIKGIKGVSFNTPVEDSRTCGIANFALKGYTPSQLAARLYDDYKIFTVGIESEAVNGVRVTPHLYTKEADLDKLAEALNKLAAG